MKRPAASALVAIVLMFSHTAQALVAATLPCVEDVAGSAVFLDDGCAHDDAAPAVAPSPGREATAHCPFCATGMCRLAQAPAMVTRFGALPYAPPVSLRLAEPVARHFPSPLFEYLRPPD